MNNTLQLQTGILWLSVILYVFATITNTWGVIFQKEKAERTAYKFIVIGLIFHGAAIFLWWRLVGHGPYMARYEVLSSMSWVLLVFFLLFCRWYPKLRPTSILSFLPPSCSSP